MTPCHDARRPSGARRSLTRSSVRFPSPPLVHARSAETARGLVRRSARSSTSPPNDKSVGRFAPLPETRARFPGRRTRKRTAWSRRASAERARPRPEIPATRALDASPARDRSLAARCRARDLERHADPRRRRPASAAQAAARLTHGAASPAASAARCTRRGPRGGGEMDAPRERGTARDATVARRETLRNLSPDDLCDELAKEIGRAAGRFWTP